VKTTTIQAIPGQEIISPVKEPEVSHEISEGEVYCKEDVDEKDETTGDGTRVHSKIFTVKHIKPIKDTVIVRGEVTDIVESEKVVGTEIVEEIVKVSAGLQEPYDVNVEKKTSVQESEETLPDGTWVKRKIHTTNIGQSDVASPAIVGLKPNSVKGMCDQLPDGSSVDVYEEHLPDGRIVTKRVFCMRVDNAVIMKTQTYFPDGSLSEDVIKEEIVGADAKESPELDSDKLITCVEPDLKVNAPFPQSVSSTDTDKQATLTFSGTVLPETDEELKTTVDERVREKPVQSLATEPRASDVELKAAIVSDVEAEEFEVVDEASLTEDDSTIRSSVSPESSAVPGDVVEIQEESLDSAMIDEVPESTNLKTAVSEEEAEGFEIVEHVHADNLRDHTPEETGQDVCETKDEEYEIVEADSTHSVKEEYEQMEESHPSELSHTEKVSEELAVTGAEVSSTEQELKTAVVSEKETEEFDVVEEVSTDSEVLEPYDEVPAADIGSCDTELQTETTGDEFEIVGGTAVSADEVIQDESVVRATAESMLNDAMVSEQMLPESDAAITETTSDDFEHMEESVHTISESPVSLSHLTKDTVTDKLSLTAVVLKTGEDTHPSGVLDKDLSLPPQTLTEESLLLHDEPSLSEPTSKDVELAVHGTISKPQFELPVEIAPVPTDESIDLVTAQKQTDFVAEERVEKHEFETVSKQEATKDFEIESSLITDNQNTVEQIPAEDMTLPGQQPLADEHLAGGSVAPEPGVLFEKPATEEDVNVEYRKTVGAHKRPILGLPVDEESIIPDEEFHGVHHLPHALGDDFETYEEILPDGTVVTRRVSKTKVRKIVTRKIRRVGPDGEVIEDVFTEEVSDQDAMSETSSVVSSTCDYREISSPVPSLSPTDLASPDDSDIERGGIRVFTDTIEGEPQIETDVQEYEETLPDGTIVKRKVIKTKQKQTIVKRVVMEGPETALPASEEQAQEYLNQSFEPGYTKYTDTLEGEPESHTDVQEVEEILEDGTVIKRRLVTTTEHQLKTERVVLEGEEFPEFEGHEQAFQEIQEPSIEVEPHAERARGGYKDYEEPVDDEVILPEATTVVETAPQEMAKPADEEQIEAELQERKG